MSPFIKLNTSIISLSIIIYSLTEWHRVNIEDLTSVNLLCWSERMEKCTEFTMAAVSLMHHGLILSDFNTMSLVLRAPGFPAEDARCLDHLRRVGITRASLSVCAWWARLMHHSFRPWSLSLLRWASLWGIYCNWIWSIRTNSFIQYRSNPSNMFYFSIWIFLA